MESNMGKQLHDQDKEKPEPEPEKASTTGRRGEKRNFDLNTLPACSIQPDAPNRRIPYTKCVSTEYQPTHEPATMQGCNMDNISVSAQS
jgi:hypothetical protein